MKVVENIVTIWLIVGVPVSLIIGAVLRAKTRRYESWTHSVRQSYLKTLERTWRDQ